MRVEALEDRSTPATLNPPWADPRHLTLSFAPDGTDVAGHASGLFAALEAARPGTWQRDILRAFQSWAVLGNINIAVEADGGQPLGAAGARQGDARFGDIRVAAVPMTGETLAVGTPPSLAVPGTWSGDVLFNSAADFGRGGRNLFTVALHEAGHALGLEDNRVRGSAMYHQMARTLTRPSASDAARLQSLFGRRAGDRHEGRGGNNSTRTATFLATTGDEDFRADTPLIVYGDVTTGRDVDYFALRPAAGHAGTMMFRLQSAGVSLLAPSLAVLDARGRVLGQASSTNPAGDVVEVTLDAVDPAATYYLRVRGATRDVFGVGGYSLAVIHVEPPDDDGGGGGKRRGGDDDGGDWTPQSLDAVMRGPFEELSRDDLDYLLGDINYFVNDDEGGDDNLDHARRLSAMLGYAANTHYQMIGSLSSAGDADSYQVVAPRGFGGQPGVLTATVWTIAPHNIAPRVALFGPDKAPLAARVLANGNGSFTVQATGVPAGATFFLEVRPGDAAGLGNYRLTADFGTRATTLQGFGGGELTDAAPADEYDLYVARVQLFHVLLAAQGGPVRLTVLDAGGTAIGSLTAADGQAVSGPGLLLKPGQYRVRVESPGDGTTIPALVRYSLGGSNLVDPIGPIAGDPSTRPQYINPTNPNQFVYPLPSGPLVTTTPFLWALRLF